MFVSLVTVLLMPACRQKEEAGSAAGFRLIVQCVMTPSAAQMPAYASARSMTDWNAKHACHAITWRIPQSVWISSGESGRTSFSLVLPDRQEADWIDPLVEGDSVVIRPTGLLESHRRTGQWGSRRLQPTGETLHGMSVMRFEQPSRQRILIGDGFAVMAWLPDDGPFTVQRAGISNALVAINPATEALISVSTVDYPQLSRKAFCLRATLESFRSAPADKSETANLPRRSAVPTDIPRYADPQRSPDIRSPRPPQPSGHA